MSMSDTDQIVGSTAVGFTLGLGLLTVWEAIKQTKRSKNPRRSAYIYMIWYAQPHLSGICRYVPGYLPLLAS